MPTSPVSLDYEEIEDKLEDVWDNVHAKKYHLAQDLCQVLLRAIEKDLGDDFGQDQTTATLYEDSQEIRRKSYLNVLQAYQQTLRHLVYEILLHITQPNDLDPHVKEYQTLRETITKEISTAAYLLGQYNRSVFLTAEDVDDFDEAVREHGQFVLKDAFLMTFKIVVQTLGNLNRADFERITEPYKDLRALCEQSLQILNRMHDDRFFGSEDAFIQDYMRDVSLYLQILWYLGIKSDLNKIDKFLDPNTYSQGLDQFCQVFAALLLLEGTLSNLDEACWVGLNSQAVTELLEEYIEYWIKIIQHEEQGLKQTELYQILETDRLVTEGLAPAAYQHAFDLRASEGRPEQFQGYLPLEAYPARYAERIAQEPVAYVQQADLQEFEQILQDAAIGIGVKVEANGQATDPAGQAARKMVFRYEYGEGERLRQPAVLLMVAPHDPTITIRLLHEKWVERIYKAWTLQKRLRMMRAQLDQHVVPHEKTKYRLQFPTILFLGTPYAIRFGEYKPVKVPNPDGRKLRPDTTIAKALDTLRLPIFATLLADLKLQYRSLDGVKLQALRWEWFAQRKLPDGYFEAPKYDYLKYVNSDWKEKQQRHAQMLRKLIETDDEHDDDDDDEKES